MLMSIVYALIGGALIGVAAGAFLLLTGRIAGISGIVGGLLKPMRGDVSWRLAFAGGMLTSGLVLSLVFPSAFPSQLVTSYPVLAIAGLLVGFGTRLGSGCTSGHGVCGIARLSPRSLIATGTFMLTGAITVLIASRVFGRVL